MGRPIKKLFIGNTAQSGTQIACNAWIPGDEGVSSCWIAEQIGTGRYNVTRDDGILEGTVTLVNTDAGNLIIGQASVEVTPFASAGGGLKYAEIIYDNTVRTFDGMHYKWYFSGTTTTEVDGANIQSA